MNELLKDFGWLVGTVISVVGFWWAMKREQRDQAAIRKNENRELEERLEEKIRDVVSEHRELKKAVEEDRRDLFEQVAGTTNGIARMEGSLVHLEKTLESMDETIRDIAKAKVDRNELS